jgi:hypothetical protein
MSATPKVFMTAAVAAAVAALAVSTASTAGAQDLRFASRSTSTANVGATIPTVDEARQLVADGKWKDARSAFNSIVDNARVKGDYAREALEELANLKYLMEDVHGAAQTFEQLGAEAEIYGDPATEIDARFKAAVLFQEAHDKRAVALQMPRIKALLKSPVISDATRENITKRIARY